MPAVGPVARVPEGRPSSGRLWLSETPGPGCSLPSCSRALGSTHAALTLLREALLLAVHTRGSPELRPSSPAEECPPLEKTRWGVYPVNPSPREARADCAAPWGYKGRGPHYKTCPPAFCSCHSQNAHLCPLPRVVHPSWKGGRLPLKPKAGCEGSELPEEPAPGCQGEPVNRVSNKPMQLPVIVCFKTARPEHDRRDPRWGVSRDRKPTGAPPS